MLGEKSNLPNVIGIVSQLPVDRLNNRVCLATNQNSFFRVRGLQGLERREEASPGAFPVIPKLGAGSTRLDHELQVTIPVRLFAIRGQEVGPAREHIPRDVLHDDSNAVGFGIENNEVLIILAARALSPLAFVSAKGGDGVVEIMLRERLVHDNVVMKFSTVGCTAMSRSDHTGSTVHAAST